MKFNSEESVRLADSIEACASRDLYATAPADLDLRSQIIAGATVLLAPKLPVSYFNRTIGLGMQQPASPNDLDAVTSAYRAAGIQAYWIHLNPLAQPQALPQWLEARDFELAPRRSWAKFLRGAEPLPAIKTSLRVRLAAGADAPALAQVVCAAYGLPALLIPWFEALVGRPGWQVLVATADAQIVATGAAYIRGRTAWLGIGATLPEFRKRGAQTALLAARIEAAAAQGCTILATETGDAIATEPNPSLNNIRRCGFTQVCSRLNYAPRQ
jgi:GNAT superfamily N-acetyltransferase